MNTQPIVAHVRMDAKTFRRFALFDTFIIHRRWIAPSVFAMILAGFSAIAFFLSDHAQSFMIGTLLLSIGLGLPAVYLLHFLLQVNDQCRSLGLKNSPPVYTLILSEKELRIINDMRKEAEVGLPWSDLHGIWRGSHAYYIYANPSRAFILPDGQHSLSPADLQSFFQAHVAQPLLHGRP